MICFLARTLHSLPLPAVASEKPKISVIELRVMLNHIEAALEILERGDRQLGSAQISAKSMLHVLRRQTLEEIERRRDGLLTAPPFQVGRPSSAQGGVEHSSNQL